MNEIIKIQLEHLQRQRSELIEKIANSDENGMQYYNLNNELKQHISVIDMEINGYINKLQP